MAKAKVLTRDEIKRVMRIADTGKNGLRDRVALSLSVLAGMRVGESIRPAGPALPGR